MGKFVYKETANGGFKFDLKAGNGEVILSSQIYKSEKSCLAGIESVRNNAASEVEDQTVEGFEVKKHPKYEMYTDKRGEVRFRLKAKNGEIIATSEGYKRKASALNGIDSIKRNAPDAPVAKAEA
ncbi:MAG: YegP family protein [Ruminococcus sp.]|nr:YegP family protein [Ruminococcus sp.]